MYRYFLHELHDWPVAGACNPEPFGPAADGSYLATFDAADPICSSYELDWPELSASEARQWAAGLAAVPDVPGELQPALYGDAPEEQE